MATGEFELPLPGPEAWTERPREADRGTGHDARPLWLPPDYGAIAVGGLGNEPQASLPPLQRTGAWGADEKASKNRLGFGLCRGQQTNSGAWTSSCDKGSDKGS